MKEKKKWEVWMGCFLLTAVLLLSTAGVKKTVENAMTQKDGRKTVAVDAGHGGADPGKIGVNGAQEKDINLAVAKILKQLLEEEGFSVVMTREKDEGLYEEGSSSKKQQDMKKRCEKIDEAQPMVTVSIHQNSYTEQSVRGPQVFYYSHSDQGLNLAKNIQDALNTELKIAKPRQIKENDTYYILRKTQSPVVIVECGFLSNPEEADLLTTQEYQEKVAQAIKNGILSYAHSAG